MSRVREIVLIKAWIGSKHTLREEHATFIDAITVTLSDIFFFFFKSIFVLLRVSYSMQDNTS
jgi:hypothetical protein